MSREHIQVAVGVPHLDGSLNSPVETAHTNSHNQPVARPPGGPRRTLNELSEDYRRVARALILAGRCSSQLNSRYGEACMLPACDLPRCEGALVEAGVSELCLRAARILASVSGPRVRVVPAWAPAPCKPHTGNGSDDGTMSFNARRWTPPRSLLGWAPRLRPSPAEPAQQEQRRLDDCAGYWQLTNAQPRESRHGSHHERTRVESPVTKAACSQK
jgi:hypothetical protein